MDSVLNYISSFIREPVNFILIIGVIFFIVTCGFKLNYFNCLSIINGYIECFKIKKNGKLDKGALGIAFFLPFILSVISVKRKVLDSDIINNLTVVVSILASMFFMLLTVTIDIKDKYAKLFMERQASTSDRTKINNMISKIFDAIMFEILISISILIMCFVGSLAGSFTLISSIATYYLAYVLVINLFMLLKRVYLVIKENLK